MSTRQYSVSLLDQAYPFRSDLSERAALLDEVPNSQKRKITPRILLMQNCLPCEQGYDSLDSIAPIAGVAGRKFDKVYNFFTSTGQKALFSPSYGSAYVLIDGETTWTSKLALAGDPPCSIMYIRGETYFFYRNYGLYKYNAGTTNLDAVGLTALIVANILGVTSASNYSIAFDRTTIYYTSRIETAGAIDFTPELGVAGSLSVLAIRGDIVTCLPYANGFIVYTKDNAVMASYSGNAQQPFVFREIPGSAGVVDEEYVAWDTNIGVHFVWSRSGLQQVAPDKASNIFPSLMDMLRERTLESFNEDTGVFTRTESNVELAIKVSLIGHRYLCVSYGQYNETPKDQEYEAAFIYDLDLKRWGVVKEQHVDMFMYTFTGGINFLTYNDLASTPYNDLAGIRYEELTTQATGGTALSYRIAVLKLDGTIITKNRANMAGLGAGTGVLLLGGIAVRPERMTYFDEIRCSQSQLTKVKIYGSQYSDALAVPTQVVTPTAQLLSGNLVNQRYLHRITTRSSNLLLKGRFHLTDLNAYIEEVGER